MASTVYVGFVCFLVENEGMASGDYHVGLILKLLQGFIVLSAAEH